MNLQEVKDEVKRIKSISNDDEMAHAAEDDLRERFLKYVISCPNYVTKAELKELAVEVMKTSKIKFGRWTA